MKADLVDVGTTADRSSDIGRSCHCTVGAGWIEQGSNENAHVSAAKPCNSFPIEYGIVHGPRT